MAARPSAAAAATSACYSYQVAVLRTRSLRANSQADVTLRHQVRCRVTSAADVAAVPAGPVDAEGLSDDVRAVGSISISARSASICETNGESWLRSHLGAGRGLSSFAVRRHGRDLRFRATRQTRNNIKRDIAASMWKVVYLPEAKAERAELSARDRVAVDNAVAKLEAIGSALPYPHSSNVERWNDLRELRPQAGKSPWRALYRQVGDPFVVARSDPKRKRISADSTRRASTRSTGSPSSKRSMKSRKTNNNLNETCN